MADELDELIGDEPTETVEEVTPEPEAVEAQGEEEATPPVAKPEESTEHHAPIAALVDERQKRQAAETRVRELEAASQQPAPNPIDDPEGALDHLRGEFSQGMWAIKSGLSRDMMSSAHPDYAEKESAFIEMAQANPGLVAEMHASENPARFAYDTAKNAQEYQAMQNVDEYRAKLKAELRAELAEEGQAGADKASRTASEIQDALGVGALASARASTSTEPVEDDLSSILDGR